MRRQLAIETLMSIARLQPAEFRTRLIEHEPELVQFFAAIDDPDDAISGPLIRGLPTLIGDDTSFQQIIAFNALDAICRSAARNPDCLKILVSVLRGNSVGQDLFLDNSGYFVIIERFIGFADGQLSWMYSVKATDPVLSPHSRAQELLAF
jgi:hypothetical protein